MFRRLGRFTAILAAVLTIAIATMAIATVVAGAASSKFKSTTTVSIGAQGTLVSGPGVAVTLKYSCFPNGPQKGGYGYGGGAFGDVRVTDVHGNTGFGFFTPTCNDANQTAVIIVPGVFIPGAAAANAFICGFDCNSTSREIKIA